MGRLWIEKAEWDNLARSETVDECRALEKNATHADAGAHHSCQNCKFAEQ